MHCVGTESLTHELLKGNFVSKLLFLSNHYFEAKESEEHSFGYTFGEQRCLVWMLTLFLEV